MTSEEQTNLELAETLDSTVTGIPIKDRIVTLRELLTAVASFQNREDTRWITKFIRKRPVSVDDIMWELPEVCEASFGSGDGTTWRTYYAITKENLYRLCSLGLLWSEIKYSNVAEKYLYYYGLTSLGKAFVNYNEKV